MSSYNALLKHPKTGKLQGVLCIDDYFGKHRYGYAFKKDGTACTFEDSIEDCDVFSHEELCNKE